MKFVVLFFALIVPAVHLDAQKPAGRTKATSRTAAKPTPAPALSEKERWEAALAITDPSARIAAIGSFLSDFPASEQKVLGLELVTAARGDLAATQFTSGDPAAAIATLNTAVSEAPQPFGDKLFAGVISKFPGLLYANGQRAAAAELASIIEKRSDGNPIQLLALANFYLGAENSTEALRLALKATELDPASAEGFQVLSAAHRLSFDLESSAAAAARAVELQPGSLTAKRMLAELKRAIGKPAESLELFRQVLSAKPDDLAARSGEVLALFDSGKRSEAEAAFDRVMKDTPGNVALVAAVANWYAANGDGPNAVIHAEEAIDLDPRYVWSHIALGRGHMLQKKFAAAEQALIKGRKYGRFPTLEYEIARARVGAGFYRDAADDLRGVFDVSNGVVSARLGGRIPRSSDGFEMLLRDERRASIFEPSSQNNSALDTQLLALLEFDKATRADPADVAAVSAAASRFANGPDEMQLFRQLYASWLLLEKRIAPERALEISRQAMAAVDAGLESGSSSTAVMAAELYDARRTAFARDQFIVVPEVPRQTLSAILRGRIEETAGWALHQQGKNEDAEVRLRRAISVVPANSAWWRSTMWRLGSVLEANGKAQEALDSYVAVYRSQPGSGAQYLTIRAAYQNVNGNTDKLEDLIGPNPSPVAIADPVPAVEPTVPSVIEPPIAAPIITALPINDTPVNPPISSAETPPVNTENLVDTETLETPSPTATNELTAPAASAVPTVTETPATDVVKPAGDISPAKSDEELKIEPLAKPVDAPVDPPVAEPIKEPDPAATVVEKPITGSAVFEPKPETEKEAVIVPVAETTVTASEIPAQNTEPASPAPKQEEPPIVTPLDEKVVTADPAAKSEELPPVDRETPLPSSTAIKPEKARPIPSGTKSLFDPVIITIPAPKRSRAGETAMSETEAAGAERKRTIDSERVALNGPCKINVSQSNISLLNNVGSVAILVGTGNEGDLTSVTARSGSPSNVEITAESAIQGITGRRLFVIRSISKIKGVFQVAFELPCGKRDITVTVH